MVLTQRCHLSPRHRNHVGSLSISTYFIYSASLIAIDICLYFFKSSQPRLAAGFSGPGPAAVPRTPSIGRRGCCRIVACAAALAHGARPSGELVKEHPLCAQPAPLKWHVTSVLLLQAVEAFKHRLLTVRPFELYTATRRNGEDASGAAPWLGTEKHVLDAREPLARSPGGGRRAHGFPIPAGA